MFYSRPCLNFAAEIGVFGERGTTRQETRIGFTTEKQALWLIDTPPGLGLEVRGGREELASLISAIDPSLQSPLKNESNVSPSSLVFLIQFTMCG